MLVFHAFALWYLFKDDKPDRQWFWTEGYISAGSHRENTLSWLCHAWKSRRTYESVKSQFRASVCSTVLKRKVCNAPLTASISEDANASNKIGRTREAHFLYRRMITYKLPWAALTIRLYETWYTFERQRIGLQSFVQLAVSEGLATTSVPVSKYNYEKLAPDALFPFFELRIRCARNWCTQDCLGIVSFSKGFYDECGTSDIVHGRACHFHTNIVQARHSQRMKPRIYCLSLTISTARCTVLTSMKACISSSRFAGKYLDTSSNTIPISL